MKKTWLLAMVGGIALLLIAGGIALAQSTDNSGTSQTPGSVSVNIPNQQTGIWVNGLGRVRITPDIATLAVGVEAQSTNVSEAQAEASAAMNKVVAALKADGVAEKDIQTQYFNISQVTKWDDQKQTQIVIGYRVSNSVQVKIRDLSKAGQIIDDVTAAGGDLTRINGITFSLEDPTAAAKQARDLAMADAKAKAEQMAADGGVKLGKPTYISESSYYPPLPTQMAYDSGRSTMASAVVTPVSAGEMEITVNVQVAYSILN